MFRSTVGSAGAVANAAFKLCFSKYLKWKKKSKIKEKKYECNNVSKTNVKSKSNLDMKGWVENMTCIIEAI